MANPTGVAVDEAGQFVIADHIAAVFQSPDRGQVRKVSPQGFITTIAGKLGIFASFDFNGDNILALEAGLSALDVAMDPVGNIYIADYHNQRIRKVTFVLIDGDGDGIEYLKDNCPFVANPDQTDTDFDAQGDPCDPTPLGDDLDADGLPEAQDNCAFLANPDQADRDDDNLGDLCDGDNDNDGLPDAQEVHLGLDPLNPDSDGNGVSDADEVVPIITTIAGNGVKGYDGDGKLAVEAALNRPRVGFVDATGQVFVVDLFNHRVRKIDLDGIITTIAGTGAQGFPANAMGGPQPAVEATLGRPFDLIQDPVGNIYVADFETASIRKIDPGGTLTKVAGAGFAGFFGDGSIAAVAALRHPTGVVLDQKGQLVIADHGVHKSSLLFVGNLRIRRIDTDGFINTIAGTGKNASTGDGGPAIAADMAPLDLVFDPHGDLYLVDSHHHVVRKIDKSGMITNVAGTGVFGFHGDGGPAEAAQFYYPYGVAIDPAGNLFIADQNNHRIRKVDGHGIITTVAGTGEAGFSGDGDPATLAGLSLPMGIATDRFGNLYFGEAGNDRVRKVTFVRIDDADSDGI
ncbi:MAG: thrombospondin type 3 repeat-containing protein, partial [Deltaproteobacteria bacterium]|nr:thrombospondin type 3 repeat-containing protein [Deltaproteobacteria bacterium]